ncbi:MAG: 3-deoxy-8-phosphooctulonate synthase [Magnetospirillum sp.]|nr:3-deoxy-8-phosphooctulonate synthase [Magnetospirillum sp.]
MPCHHVAVGESVILGNDLPLVLIAGPCQLESRAHALECALALKEMAAKAGMPLIYKTSYDKANRSSLSGRRGIGIKDSLPIFAEIRESLGLPVLTDIHTEEQCKRVAKVIDILQIPAFLCRQTDLLLAAGRTGCVINIKKGQFLAPSQMANAAAKVESTGNTRIVLTERGSCFGYGDLVADMRALPIMAATGYPVVMDATHAVQSPGGQGASSGGDRRFAPVLARAAVAVGIAAVFIETHPDPDRAPSDGPNMLPLAAMPDLIATLKAFDRVAKAHPIVL